MLASVLLTALSVGPAGAGSREPVFSSCTFMRIDAGDAAAPEKFVSRLKTAIVAQLKRSGTAATAYPVPCRWERASGRVTYCIADRTASFDDTDALLIDESGMALTFRVIDFPSPMHTSAQIYLLATPPTGRLEADRDQRYRRVQITGGFCDAAIRRGIVDAGAVPLE